MPASERGIKRVHVRVAIKEHDYQTLVTFLAPHRISVPNWMRECALRAVAGAQKKARIAAGLGEE